MEALPTAEEIARQVKASMKAYDKGGQFAVPSTELPIDNGLHKRMRFIVDHLYGLEVAESFREPVDLKMFTDYSSLVRRPMDLSTLKVRSQVAFCRPENVA